MVNESHINLSTEDEKLLEDIEDLSEDKKNKFLLLLRKKEEANRGFEK